jgi:hypothetical protein
LISLNLQMTCFSYIDTQLSCAHLHVCCLFHSRIFEFYLWRQFFRNVSYCTMLGLLDHLWPQLYSYSTEDAVRIGNSFITVLNHTQLSITRLRVYTLIITYTLVTKVTYNTLTRLHWLTSQLSITFTNYRRLYIFTLPVSVSYRDLTRRADFHRLTSRTARYKLVETLLKTH